LVSAGEGGDEARGCLPISHPYKAVKKNKFFKQKQNIKTKQTSKKKKHKTKKKKKKQKKNKKKTIAQKKKTKKNTT
jgi:hypothetical protein